MSDCRICRNYKICKSEKKDKVDKCFFVYPTEEELAKDTKEYEIGYKQGISDERKRIVKALEERFSWLNKATKYGNADAEQQNFSYSTIMMYEVADLINEAIEIVIGEKNEWDKQRRINYKKTRWIRII